MFSLKGLKWATGAVVSAFAMAGLTAGPATSASNLCTKRTSMVKALSKKYEEQRRGMGIASKAGVMEFYVSEKGTWTMLMTMPNGMSCILAAGKDWEEIAVTPIGTNS